MSTETPPTQSAAPSEAEAPEGADAAESVPADSEADRISLRGLTPVSPSVDLARTVPQIINRRSRGRFDRAPRRRI